MYYYSNPQQNQFGGNQGYMQNQTSYITPILKGRPVSSIEEARAAQIDFDGSLFIFPDVANKRIYTKQINIDGTATLNQYNLAQPTTPAAAVSDINSQTFVTREEFTSTLAQLKEMIQNQKDTKQSSNKEAIALF